MTITGAEGLSEGGEELIGVEEQGGLHEEVAAELPVTSLQIDALGIPGLEERTEGEGPSQPAISIHEAAPFLAPLQARFEQNRELHPDITWNDVAKAILATPGALSVLCQLENTGGEPDVIGEDKKWYLFGDCAEESPTGRRNVVYDPRAEIHLKQIADYEKPNGNARNKALEWQVALMNEAQYTLLQRGKAVDINTSSWIETPSDIRQKGQALRARRDGEEVLVFQSEPHHHSAATGFRCVFRVPKVS